MERIRTFIAIELPRDIRGELFRLQEELKSPGLSAKWVSKDNIHLTLKFLGSVESNKIVEIKRALVESLKEEGSFSFILSELGVFPSLSRPRVLWVGVTEGKERLREIAGKVEAALEPIGFPREKRGFSAHVTLARIKREENLGELKEKLEGKDYRSRPILVSKIAIMKSDLTPEGPIYTKLDEVRVS